MPLSSTIQSFFKKFLDKGDSSVLGIDIGSSTIKVVQLKKKKGKAVLETYGELALGSYAGTEPGHATNLPPDKLVAALGDLLREAKTTTKKCGVAIPVGSSLITTIELPKVKKAELEKMIPLEARKYIPVPISEVSLDFWIIPEESSGLEEDDEAGESSLPKDSGVPQNADAKPKKVEALIVAIHNEVVSKYQGIIKDAGLDSSFIELETFSTIRAVLDQNVAPEMIFDLGAASTKLYIVERGVVRSSHTVNRGSQDITITLASSLGISLSEAEAVKRSYGAMRHDNETAITDTIDLATDYIFSEANRTILGFQKKYNKNVGKVILTGGGVGPKGFLALAQKNLETKVELGNPFAKVEFPAFLEGVLKMTGSEFAVAVGVALRRLEEVA